MKITEKLKGRLQSAKSADEVQTILKEVKKRTEEAGLVLNDEELDEVSGGSRIRDRGDNPRTRAPRDILHSSSSSK